MKNTLKIGFIALLIVTCSAYNASAQKVAYIHFDSLISLLPESKVAQQKIQEYAQQLEQMVIAMETELQTKINDFQSAKDMPDVVRSLKEKELNDLNQRIQDFRMQAQEDYQNKSTELSQPVIEKAKKAIDEVAIEKGYKYVLDISSGAVLFNSPENNIMSFVIKKLGISTTAPAASVAPATTPTTK